MLPLKNLTDATLASLSILRKTRWRPIWRPNIWAGHNKASICTQGIFNLQIFDIILEIEYQRPFPASMVMYIKNASKMAARIQY